MSLSLWSLLICYHATLVDYNAVFEITWLHTILISHLGLWYIVNGYIKKSYFLAPVEINQRNKFKHQYLLHVSVCCLFVFSLLNNQCCKKMYK